MKQLFQSVWWWTRVAVLVAVALYVLLLLARNADQSANIWYWPGRPAENTSIIALALVSFIAGGLICSIGWALFSAWINYRRTRELRRRRLAQQQRAELQRKASKLRVKPPVQPIVRAPKPIAPPTSPPAPVEVDFEPSIVTRPEVKLTDSKPTDPRPTVEAAQTLPLTIESSDSPDPIAVEAHRATPFASHPIAPGAAAGTAPKPAESTKSPEVIDPPEPSN